MPRHRPIPQFVVRAHDPRRAWLAIGLVLLAWLMSLGLIWHIASGTVGEGELQALRERFATSEKTLDEKRHDIEALKEQVVISERADQVSRTANEALQQTLREREEEIASLRADAAFYQRLVGGQGERRGLTVHEFGLRPIGDSRGFGYTLTLTQNLKKGAVSEGEIAFEIEGVTDQKLVTLTWKDVAAGDDTAPLAFNFKYFQRLEGNLMLPEGFTPNRVVIRASAKSGERAEQAFAWKDALAQAENDYVRQQ